MKSAICDLYLNSFFFFLKNISQIKGVRRYRSGITDFTDFTDLAPDKLFHYFGREPIRSIQNAAKPERNVAVLKVALIESHD